MNAQRGFTLLEVLITLIVLAIGLLGLANLQSKIHVTEVESYQRAHAVLLMQDIVDRIYANRGDAAEYVSSTALGTSSGEDCSSSTLAGYSATHRLAHSDRCDWGTALLGASEKRSGANVGAMIGARGCIALVQASNNASGTCTPGIYRVSVVWQGLFNTAAPASGLSCGVNAYGNEKLRRVISTQISIGLPTCS